LLSERGTEERATPARSTSLVSKGYEVKNALTSSFSQDETKGERGIFKKGILSEREK